MLPVKKTILLKDVKVNMLVSSDLLGKGYFKVVSFNDNTVSFVPFTKIKDKEFKDLNDQLDFYEKHKTLQNRKSKKEFKVYGLHSSNVDKIAQQKVKERIDEQVDDVKGLHNSSKKQEPIEEEEPEKNESKMVKVDFSQFKEMVDSLVSKTETELSTIVSELKIKGKSYNKKYVELSVSELVTKGGVSFLNKNNYEFCFQLGDKLVFLTEGGKK